MDPKPSQEETPIIRSPLPENQENEYEEHALVNHKSIGSPHCDGEDKKESKTLENFKTQVLEFARESRMSPEHILLIERSFPDLVNDLHVPDHPPYAAMIYKAITELDEAGGSTEEAISYFIRKDQSDLPWAHATLLKHHLEKLCESGDVVVTDEKCYMLNTVCETYNRNQTKAFNPNQIVAFESYQISASPIPHYSPYSSPSSSSSGSYSDYTPYAKERKQKRTKRKYKKKRRSDGKKLESEEEFENNEEEHFEETEEEEESEYEEESEDFYITEEELEVTRVENQLTRYKRKHTHRTEGAKKNKTEDKSEFRDEQLRVVSVKNQRNTMHNRGTKPVRGRGRPLKCSKPETYVGPKEAQVELIEAHNQVVEVPRGLKQKRGRGRPYKFNGFETETRPEETQELSWETLNHPRGVLNRPKESTERCGSPKKIGTNTDIGPKEVHKEVTTAFNHATEDLKRPREKRGRGRPLKDPGNKTNIGHKAQGEVINALVQIDCMEKPKQKRRPGRPSKNSGGQMVVFEAQNKKSENKKSEDGMKLKQGRRRFRRKDEREEVNKYLDQLEFTVIQEMFEMMKISCDDGEDVYGAASPCFPLKACSPEMEDNMMKEREQKIQSSVGRVELFDKHEWRKLPERSRELEDTENLPVHLPQERTKDETTIETDEYTTMNEMASAHVVHEAQQQQPGCIGQGEPHGFKHVTTKATPTVSNYQHENAQQRMHTGTRRLLEIEETSTFMELLQSEYQYILNDKQLDQEKKQSCGMSGKPGEDDL